MAKLCYSLGFAPHAITSVIAFSNTAGARPSCSHLNQICGDEDIPKPEQRTMQVRSMRSAHMLENMRRWLDAAEQVARDCESMPPGSFARMRLLAGRNTETSAASSSYSVWQT